jgi:hypothetical protein
VATWEILSQALSISFSKNELSPAPAKPTIKSGLGGTTSGGLGSPIALGCLIGGTGFTDGLTVILAQFRFL